MTDDRQRLLTQVAQETGQIREKVLVLIAAARARPFAVAMSTQIEGHRVLDRQTPRNHRRNKVIPASALVADAVHKNEGLLGGIAPFPIVQFQSVVDKVALLWF